MKIIAKLLLIFLATVATGFATSEVTFYDSTGQVTAYLADDSTIYLWAGTPVA